MSDQPLRAIMVDDEPLARELLRSMLTDHEEVDVVAECGSGEEAVEAIHRERPNLLFLDIQMPGMDGFQVLESISLEQLPRTIFVTAYDQFALRAFDVHALDYLLKPFDEERLEEAIHRARRDLRAREDASPQGRAGDGEAGHDTTFDRRVLNLLEALQSRDEYADRLAITMDERTRFLPIEQIDWIEADGKYVKIHAGEHAYEFREGISSVQKRLDPREFMRIHRSHLVRIKAVKEVQPWFKGEYVLILEDDTKLTTGRTYRDNVYRLLGKE